jgi:hypothetical protein
MARNRFEAEEGERTGRAAARGKMGGRPSLPLLEKRSQHIRFVVTHGEKRRIIENAMRAGRGVSEYVRDAALGCPIIAPTPAVNHEVREELARIGNNLNQIARTLNAAARAGQGVQVPPDLAALMDATLDAVHGVGVAIGTGLFPRAEPRACAPSTSAEAERLAEPPYEVEP